MAKRKTITMPWGNKNNPIIIVKGIVRLPVSKRVKIFDLKIDIVRRPTDKSNVLYMCIDSLNICNIIMKNPATKIAAIIPAHLASVRFKRKFLQHFRLPNDWARVASCNFGKENRSLSSITSDQKLPTWLKFLEMLLQQVINILMVLAALLKPAKTWCHYVILLQVMSHYCTQLRWPNDLCNLKRPYKWLLEWHCANHRQTATALGLTC